MLFYFGLLPLVGILAAWLIPKPPRRSGWIAFCLPHLSLIGWVMMIRFLLHPTLGVAGLILVVVGAPLAAAYAAMSFKTTSDRSLVVAGFLLSLSPMAATVLFLRGLSDIKLG